MNNEQDTHSDTKQQTLLLQPKVNREHKEVYNDEVKCQVTWLGGPSVAGGGGTTGTKPTPLPIPGAISDGDGLIGGGAGDGAMACSCCCCCCCCCCEVGVLVPAS